MKKRLLITVSGGRTSAYMAYRLLSEYSDVYEMVFVFCNTGGEHEETLHFVQKLNTFWGWPIVWLEAVTHLDSLTGCTHKIVNFESSSRDWQPYRQMIQKYGIPNIKYPHCNRELKLNVARSYARSIGWESGSYETAIGIRLDEEHRRRKDAAKFHLIYPLLDIFPSDKIDVNDFWQDQPFKLNLPKHLGNCRSCFKKSHVTLMKVMRDDPSAFNFTQEMEALHGKTKVENGPPRVFFREKKSTLILLREFSLLDVKNLPPDTDADYGDGCSEECGLNEAYE
ncbi:MAG: hypothetical protein ACR652_18590 [Methylocystis sp.]|uniref:hypothetical protein n=1 Tax=Methylocystis sp. TaxID=1911079 RepID=UPI003DA4DE56